jgi:hypothetical protein
MSSIITWQPNSGNRQNAENFTLISQWWEQLHSQEINWQQRLLPSTGDVEESEWATQRFDEKLSLQSPQVRGITFYWHQGGEERNITPRKLSLDITKGELDIYPQSQTQLVIRVSKTQIIYQNIELTNPLIVGNQVGDNYILLLRDKSQKLQVKITLNYQNLQQLLESLPKQGEL